MQQDLFGELMKKGKAFTHLLVLTILLHAHTTLSQKDIPDEDVWITIFIHGTLSAILRRPNISVLINLIRDNIEKTKYKRATKHVRNSPHVSKEQAIQGLGLHKIKKSDTGPGKAATALALIFDQLDEWLNKRKNNHNHYYTYGWSGLVSQKARYEEAKRFYKELTQEIAQFQKKGIDPKIRIVGYSHGGNMGLCLASVQEKENMKKKLSIDELILLGTPNHNHVVKKICHPMFKKVYNICSKSDAVQTLDFTLPGTIFSKRWFASTKKRPLPKKLTQIELKMLRNRTTKKRWEKNKDPRRKTEKAVFLNGKANLLRNISPAHSELWFFNWVRIGYRKHLPLSPLPAVAMLPIILKESKNCTTCGEKHQIIELRPEHEIMVINDGKGRFIRPLLSTKKLNKLKKLANSFATKRQTQEEYEKIIKSALHKAAQEIRQEKIKKLSNADLIPQIEKVFHRQLLSALTEYCFRNDRTVKVCLL